MKTISLFLLAFSLVILGCSKSDDFPVDSNDDVQLKSADNRSTRFTFNPIGEDEMYIDVSCDDEVVDVLIGDGTLTAHGTAHWIDGNPVWSRVVVNGKLKSLQTEETFRIHCMDKMEFDENWNIIPGAHTSHCNIVGDNGTHLIGRFIIYSKLNEFDIVKVMCVPNSKKK